MADTSKKAPVLRSNAADVLADGIALVDAEFKRLRRLVDAGRGLEQADSRLLAEYVRTLGAVSAAERKAMEEGLGTMGDDELEEMAGKISKAILGRKRKAG